MSGTVVIVLIVLVWLFVLAPWLLRGQKPIRKAGEAFDDTRVVYEGGSEELQRRRRPRVKSSDVRAHHFDSHEEEEKYELVHADDVEDVLTDEPSDKTLGSIFTNAAGKFSSKQNKTHTAIVDDELVKEIPAADDSSVAVPADEAEEVIEDTDAADALAGEAAETSEIFDDENERYEIDDSYYSPDDLMYPTETPQSAPVEVEDEEYLLVEHNTAETFADSEDYLAAGDSELTEEEIQFAAHRSARGGWDPQADALKRADLYRRRRRTVGGLGVALVLALVLSILVGRWAWAATAVVVALASFYLWALRQQVRAEQRLRQRRIRQLRRARLGVRNVADEELGIPHRLRRPGAVVLEIDDDSPDFEFLESIRSPLNDSDPSGLNHYEQPRRVG
ncbi:gephyrin-like molybdotransferase receptor GlpR [Corynebacterium silvaticum]|uniref:DUF3329 domain-containing protein n=1 Tax=Corynebacterium silvaticum TaxID=2320431 RepID=A0A7Y4P8A1_9CORY|nr:gephyrin-like molybdotransferase receptor GlpR [Corynebacterium silvaticum]ARU45822.1 hypothetical protein CBE74_04150 [Corynebacterium silvaticum]MBH5300372.1 hypothetical protein [Corynebacterium silvaticum]NOM64569.1 hypothetical protein [Corynebacterium silvaticum]NON69947.1 hypothetical protein [Corynebacterium silvaticum]TFA93219.1 hypothetical protein EU802_03350 [Corynebacterium silvaticum]